MTELPFAEQMRFERTWDTRVAMLGAGKSKRTRAACEQNINATAPSLQRERAGQ